MGAGREDVEVWAGVGVGNRCDGEQLGVGEGANTERHLCDEGQQREHLEQPRGLKAFTGAYPAVDAPDVERMRNAGAIPIGRTCLPDFGIGWHTDSELWGATINPWDRSRTPGASSGGEAAALATGMAPLGLGNDTLG
jgi:hypothetical protein